MTRNQTFFNLVAPLLALALPSVAQAQTEVVAKRLKRMAAELTREYLNANPDAKSVPVAIVRFRTSQWKLSENVGLATTEMLMNHLADSKVFVLVEREHLDKIVAEQRLNQSGAVDPKTAIEVGKLLGAKVLIVGSVVRFGYFYQVHARLIAANTGKVISTHYEELPRNLFDEVAQAKFNLVPDKQALGIYLLYNHRSNPNTFAGFTITELGNPTSVYPKSFPLKMIGGGVRYFPFKDWMVDFSFAKTPSSQEIANTTRTDWRPAGSRNLNNMTMVRGVIHWVHSWGYNIRSMLGGGIVGYNSNANNVDFATTIAPQIRAGFEFKPQPRLGIGLFLNYDFQNGVGTDRGPNGDAALKFNRFSVEPTFAFYF